MACRRSRACAARCSARERCVYPPAIPRACARSRGRGAGRRGRPDGRAWIAEAEAKELLRAGGVAVPDGRLAADADDAVAAAHEVGWPVALKLSAPSLLHKSEAGALALALADEAAVREADARLRSLGVAGAKVLVERMSPAGVEVFVAARATRWFPPWRSGSAGIWAEAFDEVAIVPLPARAARVERSLRALRAAPVLSGGRGSAAVDLAALAALAARVGELPWTATSRCSSSTRSRRTPRARSPSTRSPGARIIPNVIETVGIVGAGFMGSGIAESAARAGLAVVLHEPEPTPLERSRERIETSVARGGRGAASSTPPRPRR